MKFLSKIGNLIGELDSFWDIVSQSGLVFNSGINNYMNGNSERFKSDLEKIKKLEGKADDVRRNIKYKLYSHMLIPEARGDVLGLLENSDDVIDSIKKVLYQFDIEKPEIPEILKKEFNELAKICLKSVDDMVKAARSFFREISMVNDYINKVYYFEHEADKLEEDLKRKAFSTNIVSDLSNKVQIRYFAEKVAMISDEAENVCDRLSIYAIKRMT